MTHGSRCPNCGSIIGVYSTRVEGDVRIRYLGCSCGFKPRQNKVVVPIRFAPERAGRPLEALDGGRR